MSDLKKTQKWIFIMTTIAPIFFFLILWVAVTYEFHSHNYTHVYEKTESVSK